MLKISEPFSPAPSSPTALTDEEIVRRVRAGEKPLFELLMRRHNSRIYRTVFAILRDETDAEDVMQQAYVSAYLNLGQFAEQARFGTWLLRIAINEALKRRRQAGRQELRLVEEPDELEPGAVRTPAASSANPEEEAVMAELRAVLEKAIASLPLRYRLVLVLRDVEGLSTAETADLLKVGPGVVKTRLHRARAMMRDRLVEKASSSFSQLFPFEDPRCNRIVTNVFDALDNLERSQP